MPWAGMRTARCLEVIRDIRTRVDVPVVAMTYASIFDAHGWNELEHEAREAGATSFIVVDLPADVRPELKRVQRVYWPKLTGLGMLALQPEAAAG